MRFTLFKSLAMICLGMLSGGIFAPWIISNDVLPVWMNVILLSLLVFGCFMAVELAYRKLFVKIKEEYERTGSE